MSEAFSSSLSRLVNLRGRIWSKLKYRPSPEFRAGDVLTTPRRPILKRGDVSCGNHFQVQFITFASLPGVYVMKIFRDASVALLNRLRTAVSKQLIWAYYSLSNAL